ncbi:receptor-type tyrosine-protein phosphatase H-like isoform X2 [Siniperca chuatsi]|uniref:receptor-type tyrosine-protein phosphatase H-like isoform X2 n=1 Tax=Siniperca chuatsi TaxID=119488 RepID=UPI001CE168AF|nr:receptor-type tyrosine-protein phosphatase H-like isoform X2 [Siniperca chuatsi]
MDYWRIIFVLTGALVNDASAQTHQYYFVSTPVNWTEAQIYCRKVYTDLATVENTNGVSAVVSTTSNYTGIVNGTSSFVKVDTNLNWTEAQRFCRENYVDLASIRNQTENDIIANLAAGSFVWIGLHREKLWSDGSTSLFRHWASGQPDLGTEQCVTMAFNDSGRWSDNNCSLTFPFICYTTGSFRSTGQDETSITLQWNKVNNNVSFILQFNGTEIDITAPDGDGPVTHTVSSLTAGTKYTFTLFSVFENVRSSGVSITAVTAPSNAGGFRSTGQDETGITLQWNKVNNNVSFILQFNGTEIYITAPVGDGPVTCTVSSLTAGTKYTFTLFSVFENVRSSGVNITAVTAPPNAGSFRSTGQDKTSITLQWNKVNNNVSYILQFNGTEIYITAPDGDGPVTHTVSSLTAGTKYTFTLFSVFENVRSSGVNITAVTEPFYVVGLNVRLTSFIRLSDSDIQSALEELFRQYGLSPQLFSLKIRSVET